VRDVQTREKYSNMRSAIKKSSTRSRHRSLKTAQKKVAKKKAAAFARRVGSRSHVCRDTILEKFDRGEDIFAYCDLSAGVAKMPVS
jgi:hypothetical protein